MNSLRYLKRGINDKGHVANDVETEQVAHQSRLFYYRRMGFLWRDNFLCY